MTALINEFSGLPMDFQNLMSCIQCHEEEKNTVVIVETMKTIASICSEEEFGKNAFRDVGGLDFLLEFITNTDQVAILEYGLKVLAFVVDGNVHNQMHLTNQRTFTVLQAIFKKKECPTSIVKNAVVLFSTILYQNRSAQDLLQEDTYLQTLMIQYRHYAPTYTGHNEQEDPYCLDIWLNISSTLCFAVNNPLNGENQRMCSVLFPLSLRIIETSTNPLVVKASSSFLSLCIASNEKNQDSFAENEGLLILKCLLNKNFEILKSYMKECNNVVRKTTLDTISALIGIISAAVLDHEKNAVLCGKLGIVSQMIELLSIEVLSYSCKKSLILALGYSIDAYSDNRFIALDVPQFDSLLKSNLKEADQELHSTAKYLLQVCLKKHGHDLSEVSDGIEITARNSYLLSRDSMTNSTASTIGNECFIEGTALGKVTEYSNQSSFLKSSNKRSEDSLSPHKDTQQMSAQLQQRNFQKYIYRHRGSNESSKTLSQHYENRASCRNTDELSCLSGKFMLQGTEIAKNLDTSASNLFLLNSKPVSYQEKTDKYAYKSSNEEDESSECDSLSRISLQSAGHLFRLNKERMKQSVKNKSREACSFSKNGDYYVSSVIGNSGASENADANSMSKKNTKKQIKDEFLDRKKYIDRLFRNEPEGFSKPYLTSQRKRGLISGNPKTGESKKTQNRMPGCLKVIVLPGTRCPEHKLAAHFEMLKFYYMFHQNGF